MNFSILLPFRFLHFPLSFVVVISILYSFLSVQSVAPKQTVVWCCCFSLQFMGTWYEILWIAPSYNDGGDLWINYYHVYSADDYGVVTGYYSGK